MVNNLKEDELYRIVNCDITATKRCEWGTKNGGCGNCGIAQDNLDEASKKYPAGIVMRIFRKDDDLLTLQYLIARLLTREIWYELIRIRLGKKNIKEAPQNVRDFIG